MGWKNINPNPIQFKNQNKISIHQLEDQAGWVGLDQFPLIDELDARLYFFLYYELYQDSCSSTCRDGDQQIGIVRFFRVMGTAKVR